MNVGYTYSYIYLQLPQIPVDEKQIVFKHWTTIQLYAQTNFHVLVKMTVNLKSGHFSSLSSGFRKILLRSDAELPTQAENDKVEHK